MAMSHNSKGEPLVVGCNYHTTWQSNKAMRFVLVAVRGNKSVLKTRTTGANFTTDTDSLIFIKTKYNNQKANKILSNGNEESII